MNPRRAFLRWTSVRRESSCAMTSTEQWQIRDICWSMEALEQEIDSPINWNAETRHRSSADSSVNTLPVQCIQHFDGDQDWQGHRHRMWVIEDIAIDVFPFFTTCTASKVIFLNNSIVAVRGFSFVNNSHSTSMLQTLCIRTKHINHVKRNAGDICSSSLTSCDQVNNGPSWYEMYHLQSRTTISSLISTDVTISYQIEAPTVPAPTYAGKKERSPLDSFSMSEDYSVTERVTYFQ